MVEVFRCTVLSTFNNVAPFAIVREIQKTISTRQANDSITRVNFRLTLIPTK